MKTFNKKSNKLRVRAGKFTSGGGHTLLSLKSGVVLGVGRNENGQLGLGQNLHPKITSWTRLPSIINSSNIKVAAGWDFSYVFSSNEIAVAGSNAFGQIGLDQNTRKCFTLTKIEPSFITNEGINDISCGLRHVLFLTLQGNVFGLGSNRKGQLGDQEASVLWTPSPIIFEKKIIQISTGQNFSLCLTEDHKIFAFGDNKFKQLQIPLSLDPVVKVDCGWTHGIGLTKKDKVISWGRDSYGQTCGNGLESVHDVSSGSEHVLALTGGQLVSWGWNEHGNCGDGTTVNVFEPTPVKFPNSAVCEENIHMIRAGPGHSLAYVFFK